MLKLRRTFGLIFFVALLCLTGNVYSQTESRLTGTVTDSSDAAVVGAQVVATNTATGVAHRSVSNETGTYAFPSLPPGSYSVSAQMTGFKGFEQSGVALETGFVRTVDIKLEVGAVTETVRVEASTPLLDSESATVGQLVARNTLLNMPLVSRRTGSLVRLVGGVAFTEEGGGAEQLPFFTMAGGRARNQNWQLDGVNIQNNSIGNAQMGFNPPSETIEEFKVEMSNYSADLGRSGGGFIQMTTRSGTNAFHGAAYEFLRNEKLDARTFFSPQKAPLRFNVFGASLGGPIIRNKTFFFFNYEGSRYRIGQTLSSDDVPHAADREGDFSRRVDVAVLDPLTRQPFPGNIIPVNRQDPAARELVKYFPLPNTSGNDATRAPRDNFTRNGVDQTDIDWYTARIDHNIGNTDRLSGRLILGRSIHTNLTVFPEVIADPRGETQDPRTYTFAASWHRILRPNLFNEFRYSLARLPQEQISFGQGSGVNGRLGIKGVDANAFPRIRMEGLTGLGSGQNYRLIERDTQDISDHLTWIRGSHQIKAGFNLRYSRFANETDTSSGGSFNFTARATNEGLATFLLGWTSSAQFLDGVPIISRTDYWAGFVSDDWKVTPTFTVNLGLRWELDTPLWRQNGLLSNVDLTATNPVSGTRGSLVFAPFTDTGKYAHSFDRNNFSPRVGFAWRPKGNWVLRGGYGTFFNGAYTNVAAAMTVGFNQQADYTSPDGGFTPTFLLKDGIPAAPPPAALSPGFGAVTVGAAPRISPQFMQGNHVNGYHHQFNFSTQRQLFKSLLIEAGYIGNLGHKITGGNIDLNMIPLVNGRGPAIQDQRLRPFPQYNAVTHVAGPPWGNSSYHALNLRMEKRFAGGLSFLTNYTWSKFIDDIDAVSELGREAPYTHIELRRLDKSLAGSDLRHRFVGSAVYELPWGSGRQREISNSVLNQIAGGWALSFIGELRTGPVFGVTELTNRSNAFSTSQRPNLLRDPRIEGDRTRSEQLAQWFDTSAFEAPGVGVFGNSPRSFCCSSGFTGVDISAQKWFTFTEQWRLQLRSDIENLPNRPNFGIPGLQRGSGDFGRISSIVGTARRIQFALRLQF